MTAEEGGVLRVAVTGDAGAAGAAAELARLADGSGVAVVHAAAPEPGAYHLVVGAGTRPGDPAADAWLPPGDPAAARELWEGRVAPFAANLARRRRAPRRRQVRLAAPDPAWAAQAARLAARLARVTGGAAHRIDHIGSTSVPGLRAKDIIDLQVVVDDLGTAVRAAAASHAAGFVHVTGPFYGIDRHGAHHDEQVAVDADPGRPVNVHFHPAASPIWREMLLLRDWLRADPAHREEYAAHKHALAVRPGHDVDDYSMAKMPWISRALARAEIWAGRSGPGR